jgi:hypothetical protein
MIYSNKFDLFWTATLFLYYNKEESATDTSYVCKLFVRFERKIGGGKVAEKPPKFH